LDTLRFIIIKSPCFFEEPINADITS